MKKQTFPVLFKALLVVTASAYLAGCGSSAESVNTQESLAVSTFDVNKYPLNSLVCDPMGENPPPQTFQAGLKASLFYLKQGQSPFTNVGDYINKGQKSAQTLFFSQLNVPTRLFNLGFPLETGGVIKNDSGQELIEYFALRFSTILKLRSEQMAGEYEVAILADDGVIMRIRDNEGVYREFLNNDGDHPTKLGCTTQTLSMTHESEHVVQLDYYQGPRYHISLIPMWRRIDGQKKSEPLCGQLGNSLYFDYDKNSAPQKAYKDLLARGWEPIQAGNYELPQSAAFNPCVNLNAPKITNFTAANNGDGGILVTWQTDKPATGQVLYKNLSTGAEVLTKSDNVLRTHHVQIIPVPMPGQTVSVKAVAISDTMGKTVSDEILVTAP